MADRDRAAHWRDVPIPAAIGRLPRDDRGYPIPFFAAVVNGEHDFAVVDAEVVRRCADEHRCGICGGRREALAWFIGGPRMLANRVSIDPPMHLECAQFALAVCPHLAIPGSTYRTARGQVPAEGTSEVAISADSKLDRYALVAVEKVAMRQPGLLRLGRPQVVRWYVYNDAGRLVPELVLQATGANA